jgi:hypothetical protein
LLHPTVAGLLHPATGQRFIAFHASRDQIPSEDDPELRRHSPRCGFTPLEGSPSSAAVPRHRGRCLPVVSTRSTPRYYARFLPPGAHRRDGFSPSSAGVGWQPSMSSFPWESNQSPPPFGQPSSTRSTLIPARLTQLPEQLRQESGVARSPPRLVPSATTGWGEGLRRHECTR